MPGHSVTKMVTGFQACVADGLSNPTTLLHALYLLKEVLDKDSSVAGRNSVLSLFSDKKNFDKEKEKNSPPNKLIIHIIGANMNELNGHCVWREVLMRLPSLDHLEIFMVGPELPTKKNTIVHVPDPSNERLSEDCIKRKRIFRLTMASMPYEEYVKQALAKGEFERPSVCVAFNCGFGDNSSQLANPQATKELFEMWQPCLKLFSQKQKDGAPIDANISLSGVPLVISGYELCETLDDVAHAKECTDGKLDCLVKPQENPYASVLWKADVECAGLAASDNPLKNGTFSSNAALAVLCHGDCCMDGNLQTASENSVEVYNTSVA